MDKKGNPMKRICFLLLMAVSVASLAQAKPLRQALDRPNIVFFFVDDMGWADLGYRQPDVFESPNIDKLAAQGIDFTQAYIPCPTCSPSRGAILTGQHPARLKLVRHIGHNPKYVEITDDGRHNLWKTDPAQFPCVNWIDLEYTTYAEILKKHGYYNLFIGKWHLGPEEYHPIHQGFDRQIGTTDFGNPSSYYPDYFKGSDVLEQEKDRYLTDRLTDGAVDFIANYDSDKPFMISFWYYNVHSPHIGRKDYVKHFKGKGLTGKMAHYAAQVKSVDDSVGRVRKALTDKGIDKNTIIIFLSDQGGAFDNPPFHGGKKCDTLYEGGARVPFIFHWPGVTKHGSVNNSVVQSFDLYPTLVEIAEGDTDKYKYIDGVSLLETIKENSELKRSAPIYGYRAYEDLYASVREGPWKLLAYRSGLLKLYNINEDKEEKRDMAALNPEKVSALKAKLVKWEKEMGVQQYSGVQ